MPPSGVKRLKTRFKSAVYGHAPIGELVLYVPPDVAQSAENRPDQEPKYDTSVFIAEYWNAVSSMVYFLMGGTCLVLACRRELDWRINIGFVMLMLVGVGSFLFHATMRFSMKLCDEIPMQLLIFTFLIGKEDCISCMHGPVRRWRFRVAALSLITTSMLLYVTFQNYAVFVVTFVIGILIEISLDVACRPQTWETRVCFYVRLLEPKG